MFSHMKVTTRILGSLAILIGCYLSLLAMAMLQLSAAAATGSRPSASRIVVLITFIFAVCSSVIVWRVVADHVATPMRSLVAHMRDLAEGECDLTRRVEEVGHNEVGEVGIWVNAFVARMEEIVRQVTDRAQTIGESAQAMADLVGNAANEATLRQDQAARISTTMHTITAAFQNISDATQTAALQACKAEGEARTGGQTVNSTVQTIEELLQSNQETSSRIEELGRSSEAIGKIIGVINEIADQTNLLALNASIEAARAGEHGRGFAVVAGEVRRLAERTSSATKEIDATVRTIQRGTLEAVEAMHSSMGRVQSGVDSARTAGEVLVNIIDGTESLQKMVEQIAESAIQESDSTQSVSNEVNEIASAINRSALDSRQYADACRQLCDLAFALTEMVGVFKAA